LNQSKIEEKKMADYWEEETRENLVKLKEYKTAELEIISESLEQRHELESQFAELTRKTKEENLLAELKAYQSASGSMAKLLGLGIKQQAMVMIPFEIAEATKEMAKFFGTRNPSHLASSLRHALAAKQYAEAAKSSAKGAGGGAGAGVGTRIGAEKPAEEKPAPKTATIVVNVGDGIILNPKEFVRNIIDGINEAYRDNVKLEFAR